MANKTFGSYFFVRAKVNSLLEVGYAMENERVAKEQQSSSMCEPGSNCYLLIVDGSTYHIIIGANALCIIQMYSIAIFFSSSTLIFHKRAS